MGLYGKFNKEGELARLISPVFPNIETGYCLSWYYHMLGKLKY
jgi:hypothetical protein